MATAEIDLPYLSSYLTFPEEKLSSLLSSPTVELVAGLLQSVARQARAHEQIKSEKLKLDVELENVVRAADAKARVLRSSVEKGLKDAANLRQKLQEEGMLAEYIQAFLSSADHALGRNLTTEFGVTFAIPQLFYHIVDIRDSSSSCSD